MSTDQRDESTPAANTPRRSKSRRKKSAPSGFSLLARGEPQIWFTGGMLVLCLAMIIGLLVMILMSGLPTFWPRQLDLLVLNDGSLEIGQPQSTQRGFIDPSTTASESESPVASGGIAAGAGTDASLVSRHYRTANYDITGEHYRWLGHAEVAQDGIASPVRAMVVERLEHGRLYGIPIQYTERLMLDPAADEKLRELTELIEVVSALAATEATPPVDTEAIETVLNRLEELRAEHLDAELKSEMAGLQDELVQVQTADEEQWKLSTAVEPSTRWINGRRLWVESDRIIEQFQRSVEEATERREQAEDRMLEISRLDARISRLHAAVRRAELATETRAAQRIEESQPLLEEQVLLERRDEELQRAAAAIEQLLGNDAATRAALAAISQVRSEVIPAEAEALQMQLDEWLEPIRQQPAPIVAAVLGFQEQFRAIMEAKLPLQYELQLLAHRLDVGEALFSVPTAGMPLDGISQEDISQLVSGSLSESLSERLGQEAIEASAGAVEVTVYNDNLQLVTLASPSQQRRQIAVTRPGYVADPSAAERLVMVLPEKVLAARQVVRAVAVNQLTLSGKLGVYFDRWHEFLWAAPREAGTEGGVFPAIWGTVVMTLIMTVAVVPFGVMAALYLREYTHAGPLVSLIRISINNLAGVPSIVYGVFGFSFFCYTIGAFIDGGPKNADIVALPPTIWYVAFAVTAVIGTSAFFLSFFGGGPSHTQTVAKKWMSRIALILWLLSITALALLVLKSPFFEGFYREYLPNPTFGKGGLLWAALTLSLLTLPVVIVATEEALAAVPNSLREGSLACGASKWQTIRRITLPHARPGILTGAILAMARGAGEVAPLMLVGALPLAPDLPLDSEFPYFHGSRSFMHLGYQIYTLGFQSQNSEAAKPMVFTCTLLLILIIAVLNISAIYLRARLRRRFRGSQF